MWRSLRAGRSLGEKMHRLFRCDLHVHTCLSPCAELGMYPRAIVEKSLAEGLDVIAICDHNATENVQFVLKSAEGKPLTVLFGMEITSSEEVHLLALFDKLENLMNIQNIIYDHLPGENQEKIFGTQAIINSMDELVDFNRRFLLGSTEIPLIEIINYIHDFSGLAIASHIDRESFSITSQLGFIDPDIPLDALEITNRTGIKGARSKYPELSHFPFVVSSDAHWIKDIGQGVTRMFLERATISELKMAFEHRGGRYIEE